MIILEVHDGTDSFTYTDEVQEDAFERDERATADSIEPGSRSVTLISDTFIGYDVEDDIPDGAYRAQVIFDGIQVADGVIRRSGITRHPDTNEWTLALDADAKDLFIDHLKSHPISTSTTPIGVDTCMIDSDGLPNILEFDWFELQDLWDATMDQLDVQVSYQDLPGRHWFVLDVDYDDGSVKTISRQLPVYITTPDQASNRPDWTAHQLYEHLRRCLAWRIKVNYLPFPATDFHVTILTDRWSDPPATPVDLTPYILDRDRTHVLENAEMQDFALQYANDVGGEDIWPAGSTRPSEIEIYASANREISNDGESDNEDLIRLNVLVPDTRDSENVTVTGIQPDPVNHAGYLEDVTYAQPTINYRGGIYQCAIEDNAGTLMMVLARTPQDPAAGQDPIVGEHYATALARHYEIRRSSIFVVNVKVDIDDIHDELPAIADPILGCLYEENAYMVRGQSINDDTGIAEYELVRIAGTPTIQADAPTVCPPKAMSLTCISEAPNVTVFINFQPPDPSCGDTVPVSYDIYYYKPGFTFGFLFVVNLPVGTHSYYHNLFSVPAGEYIYRIESINSLGVRSQPIYDTVVC